MTQEVTQEVGPAVFFIHEVAAGVGPSQGATQRIFASPGGSSEVRMNCLHQGASHWRTAKTSSVVKSADGKQSVRTEVHPRI